MSDTATATATAKGTKRSITQETHTGQKKPRRRQPHVAPIAPGNHELAPGALLTYVPDAVTCDAHEFNAMFENQPPPTPNPMNAKTFLRRRQGTYGATYSFGRQTSVNMGAIDDAPGVVQRCVADARRRAGDKAHAYTGAHVNWYADGATGLNAHQDAVGHGMEDMPIFSYSFVAFSNGHTNTHAPPTRDFVVAHDRDMRNVAARVETRHGDLVVMAGPRFQHDLWHAVPTTARKDKAHVRRINVTVRAWAGRDRVTDQR